MGDVFDSDVDTLLNVPSAHSLVDDDTDGVLGHVVHHTCLAVVNFVWHAFLDGTVHFDVDNVSNSVRKTPNQKLELPKSTNWWCDI